MVARPPNPCLPEEIIEQVILRVDCIKSIMRCLTVCRSWYGFIKSRHFINTHNNLCNKKYLLCFHDKKLPSSLYVEPCIASIYYDSETAFQEYRLLEYPNKPLHVDGCNGLICYNTISDPTRIYLWNPSIRKVKLIPASPQDHAYSIRSCSLTFGLWFDSKTNNYEILRIIHTLRTTTVELYSLKTNSWKLINDNAPVTPTKVDTHQLTCVIGVWYWLVCKNYNWILASLDTKTWTFKEAKTMWRSLHIYLSPIQDRLVIIGYGHIYNLFRFYLDRYLPSSCTVAGVYDQRSDKFYAMPYASTIDNTMLLGVRNNGELLFQEIGQHSNLEIASCSLEKRVFKKILAPRNITCTLMKVIPNFHETLDLLSDADAAITD